MPTMADPPRFQCPQCGRSLGDSSSSTCPDCGFVIDPARIRYRGAVRYWRFLRLHRRLDYVVILLWFVAAALAYWVLSLSPTKGVITLTVIAACLMIALSRFLLFRRPKKRN